MDGGGGELFVNHFFVSSLWFTSGPFHSQILNPDILPENEQGTCPVLSFHWENTRVTGVTQTFLLQISAEQMLHSQQQMYLENLYFPDHFNSIQWGVSGI